MRTSDFDYNLPVERIAQVPAEPRDSSRLLVVDKKFQTTKDEYFRDITKYLAEGDLVVWNNSKVFKARLKGTPVLDEKTAGLVAQKNATDRILNASQVEVFLVRPMENAGVWKVLAKPARKLRLGMKIIFAQDFSAEVMNKENDGTLLVQFGENDMSVRAKANKYGSVPTPPYIKDNDLSQDDLYKKYQTIYASSEGSVAAPTAGFHFTPEIVDALNKKGVQFAEVTLHVGLGTFLPVKVENTEEHKMHSELAEITDKNFHLINLAKKEGRRVIAVGTTTVRTLEGVFKKEGALKPFAGEIDLFIAPGFKFQVVDALVTNFHLPKSTLLMLVSAFVGDREFTLKCYEDAIKKQYRFYSFGDAMLIK